MQRYTMLPELIHFLGPACCESRVSNMSEYSLTGSEAEALILHWRPLVLTLSVCLAYSPKARHSETRVAPFRAASSVSGKSPCARRRRITCAHRVLLAFCQTETPVNPVLALFKRYLHTLPALSKARRIHVEDIRKLAASCGRIPNVLK